jgi:hypothetical protein
LTAKLRFTAGDWLDAALDKFFYGMRTSALLSAADQLDEILQVQSLFDIFIESV